MGNPRAFQRLNGWLTVLWLVMVPVSIATGWVKSITYVSALSIYALVTGHLSTWQASRVEVKQDESEDADFAKIERKVDDLHEKV